MQVVTDKFFVNQVAFNAQTNTCYGSFTVLKDQVLDLNLAFSVFPQKGGIFRDFRVKLLQDNVVVAQSIDDRGLPGNLSNFAYNNQNSLVYRKKVAADSDFEVCISLTSDLDGKTSGAKTFQWGYKIYGTGYSSDFDSSSTPTSSS